MGDVLLPDHRLRSMIAGAFRRGTDLGPSIETIEAGYIESEHHANRLVDEFIDAGHVTPAEAPAPENIKLALWEAYHWYLQSVDCAPKGEFFIVVEQLCGWKTGYNHETPAQ